MRFGGFVGTARNVAQPRVFINALGGRHLSRTFLENTTLLLADAGEPLSTDWPRSLPVPSVTGYELSPQDAFSGTEMDSGPQRNRRRFTRYPSGLRVTWQFDEAEYQTFSAWFDLALDNGAKPFQMPFNAGRPDDRAECRFVDAAQPWSSTLENTCNRWRVTATLQVTQRPTLSRSELRQRLNG